MFGLISVVYIAFLINAICIVRVQGNCKAVINEINVIDPMKPENHEFIELKSTCEENLPLRGYKVIGFNCVGSSGKVQLIVNLWNERMTQGFYTIGGSEILFANMKIPNDNIKFKNGFQKAKSNIPSVSNFFVSGNKLSAIGLLYGEKDTFTDFKLTEKKPELMINDKLIEILKKNLVDLVIYAGEEACDKCALFENLHEDFSNKKYTLREFVTNKDRNDISLNRCAFEGIGFIPEKFKIGIPTPGRKNDCSGPYFIIEDNILQAVQPVPIHSVSQDNYDDLNEVSCPNEPECSSSIDQTDYRRLSSQGVKNAIHGANLTSTSSSCTSSLLYPDGGNVAEAIFRENSRKRHTSADIDYSDELEWETTKYFRFVFLSPFSRGKEL